ncbi:hypothetical protein [Thalassolituus sp. C2-1]|uniref:hypothetical protein n=1 Tax=Venatorbacter sp. C2-1 TaxID=2597518 RepID=UPI00118FDA5D|nr:hypothetical protein [Thalassolituus sp. C2-1]TVV43015.1 hypothetical protein FOT50_11240 [Thalassolituus sp. C2-1]
MRIFALIFLLIPVISWSEMNELTEDEMESTSGQSGITLSARFEFDEGSRISYTNKDAEYLDSQEYWFVVDNLTGAMEIKGLKLDLVGDFGPSKNTGALQWTLPEEMVFDNLKTDGIYVGAGKEVDAGSGHRFLMGMEIDGVLQFPAATTMSIFATK